MTQVTSDGKERTICEERTQKQTQLKSKVAS